MRFKLYTTASCTFCKQVKRLLDIKNKQYDVIDLTDSYEGRRELERRYGALTVPVLVREDGQYAIGKDMAKIMPMM